ncbi:hypothetical protein NKR19_g5856 [Coniochaeta hoffmannii]|uniref:Uncharacterized protein n=1 Tax=Coniochaeta hoffmannii TaxID=91930 RepID=A0AA38RHP7_9PEZI|nr:hypothetical protein NKR19_g5856 [Coniochaeta hoffmannii]
MVRALVPKHYKEYTEILANIDERVKLKTNDAEPFLSLFAFGVNGHTPRHRYTNDVRGGLAGLCTFGRYTVIGGNLCVPQLGLKITPGPRFFLIGTKRESVKRNAWRKLGRLYTNKELHGAAALDDSSSEWESEIGE